MAESNDSECAAFTQPNLQLFRIVSSVRGLTALVSLVCAVIVIIIIVAHKTYKFFPQRLVLSLAMAVILRSVSNALGRVDYDDLSELFDPFCFYFGGFFDLYTGWIELIAVFCITANIFCNIILCLDFNNVKFIPFLVTLVCPLLWCWIPYSLSAFGIQGAWCGITIHTMAATDCTVLLPGVWLRFGLWQIPLFVIFLLGFVIMIVSISVKVLRKKKQWELHRYDPKQQEAKQRVMRSIIRLLGFPFLYLLLLAPRLLGDVHQSFTYDTHVLIPLWVIEAIFTPLAGGVMVVAYAFDSDTVERLKKSTFWELFVACCETCLKKCLCRKLRTVRQFDCEMESRFGDSLSGEVTRHTMYVRHRLELMNNEVPRQTFEEML